jgi:hypothetical protein
MIDIALIVAFFISIWVLVNPSKVRTKWFRPELSIVEILFVVTLSAIIVHNIFN